MGTMVWFPFRARDQNLPVPIVLYTRAHCPLCDEMRAVLESAALDPYTLRQVDVDSERELKKRFGLRVPVLEIAGEVCFEGRVERRALRKVFARRAQRYRLDVLPGEAG